jgi:hypothetical protein
MASLRIDVYCKQCGKIGNYAGSYAWKVERRHKEDTQHETYSRIANEQPQGRVGLP